MSRYRPTCQSTTGLRRRLAERAAAEIQAARAAGDWQAAELLTLRQVNYPAYTREMAKRRAAEMARIPLTER